MGCPNLTVEDLDLQNVRPSTRSFDSTSTTPKSLKPGRLKSLRRRTGIEPAIGLRHPLNGFEDRFQVESSGTWRHQMPRNTVLTCGNTLRHARRSLSVLNVLRTSCRPCADPEA